MTFIILILALTLLVIIILIVCRKNLMIFSACLIILLLLILLYWDVYYISYHVVTKAVFPTLGWSRGKPSFMHGHIKLDTNVNETKHLYLANYPHHIIDYLSLGSLTNTKVITTCSSSWDNLIGKYLGGNHISIRGENKYEKFKKAIAQSIAQGHSVLVYPEGPINKAQARKHKYDLYRFRTGIFNIARELNQPITLLVTDYVDRKHFIGAKLRQIQLPIVKPNDYNTPQELRDYCRTLMLETLELLK